MKKIVSFLQEDRPASLPPKTSRGSECNILAMRLQQSVIDCIDEREAKTGLLTSELVSGGCLKISVAL